MISVILLVVFIVGYLAIVFEHNIKVDKAASALLTGTICWALFVLGYDVMPDHLLSDFLKSFNFFDIPKEFQRSLSDALISFNEGTLSKFYEHRLLHHMQEISSILFFLLGAMTIVELVDAHEGFRVITDKIKTNNKVKLLWIICIITFFFSAVLDNLTTSIVMISLLRKLISDKETRWIFAGMVVVSANAGGAWSPIGDVTTTMLWIGGQLSTSVIVINLFFPSLVAMLVPLGVMSVKLNGEVSRPAAIENTGIATTSFDRNLVFICGVLGLLFVPVFKTLTHLPPFMGMMLSLGAMWFLTELLHREKNLEDKSKFSVIGVLRKIDSASVLFFLGILLAVSALQEAGHLFVAAESLRDGLDKNIYLIDIAIGLLSAIVDNVPLVAASTKMYPIEVTSEVGTWKSMFVQDGKFWQFLAYCAGTGGSALIIGSAAGVAVMGLEKIDFIWYLKKITLIAIIGYLAGAGVYVLMFA